LTLSKHLLLAAGLLAGAPGAYAADPVKIGDINSYTAIPAFTVPYRNGWQLAMDEINKAGGVLGGRRIEVISRDDQGRPDGAASAADQLIGPDGAVLLMGTLLTQTAQTVSEIARQRSRPFLAVQPLSDSLVWSRGNAYTFRLRTSAAMQTAMLAEQAAKLPAKRWAILAPDFEQGQTLANDFKQHLKSRRPDITFTQELSSPLGKLDAASVVDALSQAKPDALFNVTFGGDLIRLVREGNAKGLFPKLPVVSPLTGEPDYLEVMADDVPAGWIVTGYPWYDIKTPEHRKFVEAYAAAYGEDPRLASLLGYDAMKAVAAALDKAGSTDPAKLAAAFEGLTVATPSGSITFRAADHQSTMGSWIGKTQLQDGAGIMTDWRYIDGAAVLPSAEAAKKLRPAN
jgi:branched-chain amino acid transport system substrate-binding protein